MDLYEIVKERSSSLHSVGAHQIASSHRRRTYWILVVAGALSTVFLFYHTVHLGFLPETSPRIPGAPSDPSRIPLKQCPNVLPRRAKPPAPINLWAPLNSTEIRDVNTYLHSSGLELNLTAESPSLSDNHIFLIELLPPPKAAALAYLSSVSAETAPERYAHAIIHAGASSPPVIKDYTVGPLPIGPRTTLRSRDVYHLKEIPYNARGMSWGSELGKLFGQVLPPLADAMQTLLGGVAVGLPNDTLVAGASAPWGFDGSFRRTWLSWKRNTAGSWLNPLNFYLYVDFSGTDPSLWKILKLVYSGQVFSTTDDFLEAFHNGTLTPVPDDPDTTNPSPHPWSSRHRPNTTFSLDLDHIPGPRSVSFSGLRFRVDEELKYISWMGWGLYVGFDRDMGLSLWDIRLRGERIIYQLAPQDALAQYAGTNPFQATTAWTDRFFGMGSNVRPLMRGYDCPHEAVYLPVTLYTAGVASGNGARVMTIERAICVFEMDTGRPLTRHSGYTDGEFGAVKSYSLTVRTITTVGNYDYPLDSDHCPHRYPTITVFDYIFLLDGTVEVRVSASGYLQGAYYLPEEASYGTRIHHNTMGSLHDHVINFKVDIDILGTENSFLRTYITQETVTQPWYDDDWGDEIIQAKVTREYVETEDDSRVKYPNNLQGSFAVVNQEAKNSWDTVRGYAIHPGLNPIHNTVVGSKRLLNNANWAKYNLAISKHKESEPSSSTMWNMNLPGTPPVNFDKFFDGENITQKDLVAWVNVGMHHLPQTEDAPNTRTSLATSSFFIAPLNYFDSDISMDSLNAVLIAPPSSPGGKYGHDDYGVDQGLMCIPDAPLPFDYIDISAVGMDGRPVGPEELARMKHVRDAPHRIVVE
ncbi:hypothetical protein HGRIS_010303 [Hohenbuehelia grisea]|uniref:Amine oxidase n=1 Tax=Hohenbuehelia grisea TaxID=104357 RepID=A0ABR3J3X3_9AGAR